MVGQSLGHYKILDKLGAGGMGEVYRAEDTTLDREVALKILPPELAQSQERLDRFQREAKTLAALDHPNIVQIFSVESATVGEGLAPSLAGASPARTSTVHFLTMELVGGKPLSQLILKGGMPLERIFEIAIPLADALATAHEKGVIHRDLKPANIMVTDEGRVKVLDFGLAKLRQEAEIPLATELPTEPLTKEGTIVGTMPYMSPEQLEGKEVDARSDIFSHGVILYEMATGERPFKGDSSASLITAIMSHTPREVDTLRAALPHHLSRIIRRCLDKDPEHRYQSAKEVRNELEDLRREEFISAAVPVTSGPEPGSESTGKRARWPLVAAAVAGVAIVLIVLIALWLGRSQPPSDQPTEALAEPAATVEAQPPMIVVLPFENLGDPEDEYFADGMTEEISSRLAAISGLGVISRNSASRYEGTQKSIRQIGEELGVDYVLEGSVRWAPQAEGQGRVRITPQLVRVDDDTQLWADSYDRFLDDFFAVQSEIAEAVVGQLGVALLPDEQKAIAARPTQSLEAHQAYLRGLGYFWDPDFRRESYELAVRMLERAVGHDPAFVAAHALLSESHSSLYWFWYDRSPERLEAAREAALRALELDPDSPEGHRALGSYHYYGHRDYQQALEEYSLAAERLPNDSTIAASIGWAQRRQGRFDEAIAGLEKALELDPRNALFASELADTYRLLRQYPEADRYCDLSISLAPNQVWAYVWQALVALSWNGALERARAAVAGAPENDVPEYWGARVTLELYQRTYQAALDQLASGPAIIGTETELHPRELLEGDTYRLMGRAGESRASYQAACAVLEKLVEESPEDYRVRSSLGRAYGGLGRRAEAIREAQRAASLLPVSRDARDGVLPVWALAVVYTMVDDHDDAIDQLEYLLAIPSWWSAWDLRLDPRWDPLRDHPRFQALLEKYGQEG